MNRRGLPGESRGWLRRARAAESAARWLERLRDHPHPAADLTGVDIVALAGHMTDVVDALLLGIDHAPAVRRCRDELGVDLGDPEVARWLAPHPPRNGSA